MKNYLIVSILAFISAATFGQPAVEPMPKIIERTNPNKVDPSEPELSTWLNDFGWSKNFSATDRKKAIRWGASPK